MSPRLPRPSSLTWQATSSEDLEALIVHLWVLNSLSLLCQGGVRAGGALVGEEGAVDDVRESASEKPERDGLSTADFDLTAAGPYNTAQAVEQLI